MPAIQLFLFKLKYFPTVWAVKIKSVSAAYKCLVSPPRESPPSALGPGRSAQPARPLLESAARGGRGLSGCPAPQRPSKLFGRLQGHLGDRREGACPDRAEDQTRFASSPPPRPSRARLHPQSAGFPAEGVSGAQAPGACLRWVPLQPGSVHEACRGRWFQFHAEKLGSPPPSRCFSSFLPSFFFSSLPSFLPFSLPPSLSLFSSYA